MESPCHLLYPFFTPIHILLVFTYNFCHYFYHLYRTYFTVFLPIIFAIFYTHMSHFLPTPIQRIKNLHTSVSLPPNKTLKKLYNLCPFIQYFEYKNKICFQIVNKYKNNPQDFYLHPEMTDLSSLLYLIFKRWVTAYIFFLHRACYVCACS